MGSEANVRHWLVGWKEVSCLIQGRRHGETQARPLPLMEGSQKPDPRGFGDFGTKRKNVEGRLEVAERHRDAPSE